MSVAGWLNGPLLERSNLSVKMRALGAQGRQSNRRCDKRAGGDLGTVIFDNVLNNPFGGAVARRRLRPRELVRLVARDWLPAPPPV